MINRILFVCMGNICRSPLAEGLLRRHAEAAGVELFVDSAGTGNWHVGDPPDARAIVAARGRGLEISAQRARLFGMQDFDAFSLIIGMDRSAQDAIEELRPPGSDTPVRLMSDFYEGGPTDVPDPYFTGKFEPVIDLIESGFPALMDQLETGLQ